MSSRADFATAADGLATRVLGALGGTGDTVLVARHIDTSPDAMAAFAAVRLIGADIFTPHVLTGIVFCPEDAAAVVKSFAAFPSPGAGFTAGTDGMLTMAWRDWATAQLLAQCSTDGAHQVAAAQPEEDSALRDTADWQRWSVIMAQLAPLAIPGLDSPVHEAARGAALSLSRGVTRSVLRRDFPTAARLTRWLAWLHHEGIALPLDPVPVEEHVRLLGSESPRDSLDLAVARHLLEGDFPQDAEAART
ncbi:hypothetical protein ABZY09_21905 [Streptomyces sp. NPDC002928]|uniref:hypothetical protein n=1 Tax=Streptomyces sp. NPDC002928 TaxID=3154440 RepID=UPI0033A614B2